MAIISFKQRLRIYLRDQFTCVYCRRPMNPLSDDLSLDHVDPGGNNTDENLATCCISCNASKGKQSVHVFMSKMINDNTIREEQIEKPKEVVQILTAIARKHGITYADLIGQGRTADMVKARADVISQFRSEGITFIQIGKLLHRDHTTIMHHAKKITS